MNENILEAKVKEIIDQCEGRMSVRIEVDDHIIDFTSGKRYQAASLIKIPILIEAFRQVESKKIDLDQIVAIPSSEKVGGSGVIFALSENAKLSIGDLMTLMIIVSDNTATNVLIDILGLETIQACTKTLGLTSTEINRKLMDMEALKRGVRNFTSPHDMVTCLKSIQNQTLLSQQSSEKILSILENQQFTHKLPVFMDDEQVRVYSKTGEINGVEHDCAIVTYQEKTAFVVVSVDQLKVNEVGRRSIRQVGKALYDYLVS